MSYSDYDEAIRRAIYTKFGREISDEIGKLYTESPLLTRHQPPYVTVPKVGTVGMLYDKGLASYILRAESNNFPGDEYLCVQSLFSDRQLCASERVTLFDYQLRSVREEFLHHLAEREIGGRSK